MRLFVPLTKTEFDVLRELARIERRRPQEQAAVILAQTLASESPQTATDANHTPKIATARPSEEAECVSA